MNTGLLTFPTGEHRAGNDEHDELARLAERVVEVPQPDTPRLEIHQRGCQVSVAWLQSDENFRLEISERAYASADWKSVGEPVQVAGGVHRVLVPGAAHVRFVRLARGRIRKAIAAKLDRASNPTVSKTVQARPILLPAGEPVIGSEQLGLLAVIATGLVVFHQLLQLL